MTSADISWLIIIDMITKTRIMAHRERDVKLPL
jgi:hypothetical protein